MLSKAERNGVVIGTRLDLHGFEVRILELGNGARTLISENLNADAGCRIRVRLLKITLDLLLSAGEIDAEIERFNTGHTRIGKETGKGGCVHLPTGELVAAAPVVQ
ncbi:MAG: hypothetical protein SOW20_01680, partial [Berryella intestinalis]|uniref:hypothetical protein n=1 Tax=Berryella intestinalis TaxID=1531429 RepID=UPI002A75559E